MTWKFGRKNRTGTPSCRERAQFMAEPVEEEVTNNSTLMANVPYIHVYSIHTDTIARNKNDTSTLRRS